MTQGGEPSSWTREQTLSDPRSLADVLSAVTPPKAGAPRARPGLTGPGTSCCGCRVRPGATRG